MLKDKLEDILKIAAITTSNAPNITVTINYGQQNYGDTINIYREGNRTTKQEQKGAVKSGKN